MTSIRFSAEEKKNKKGPRGRNWNQLKSGRSRYLMGEAEEREEVMVLVVVRGK
jgi:hypothetical protein